MPIERISARERPIRTTLFFLGLSGWVGLFSPCAAGMSPWDVAIVAKYVDRAEGLVMGGPFLLVMPISVASLLLISGKQLPRWAWLGAYFLVLLSSGATLFLASVAVIGIAR